MDKKHDHEEDCCCEKDEHHHDECCCHHDHEHEGHDECCCHDYEEEHHHEHKGHSHRVTVEDAMEANNALTDLMGENVEPRKDFITANAKFVKNLDI